KGTTQSVKFELKGFSNDFKGGRVFINNFKIAAGGLDLRSKLISEGKLSTTAITFDVNSDRLKLESMGILKEIAGVLAANADVRIKIVGHTDSDGDENANLMLSKKRAAAVKEALVKSFSISATSPSLSSIHLTVISTPDSAICLTSREPMVTTTS